MVRSPYKETQPTGSHTNCKQGCGIKQFIPTSVIQGNLPLLWWVSLWEAFSVSQKWIPFPTALIARDQDVDLRAADCLLSLVRTCHLLRGLCALLKIARSALAAPDSPQSLLECPPQNEKKSLVDIMNFFAVLCANEADHADEWIIKLPNGPLFRERM